MDIQTILSAVSSVGFPIVACVAMFWKISKQDEQHGNEINSLSQAINNNTQALAEMKQLINDISNK